LISSESKVASFVKHISWTSFGSVRVLRGCSWWFFSEKMGVNVAACHQARLVPVALEAHGLLQKVDIHQAGCWRIPSVAQRRSWRRSIQLLPAARAVNSGRRGGGGDLDLREAENLEEVTVLGGSGDQLNKKHLLQAEGITASSGDENGKLETAATSSPEVSHEQTLTVYNYIEEVGAGSTST
jgi:hypothetical protein